VFSFVVDVELDDDDPPQALISAAQASAAIATIAPRWTTGTRATVWVRVLVGMPGIVIVLSPARPTVSEARGRPWAGAAADLPDADPERPARRL